MENCFILKLNYFIMFAHWAKLVPKLTATIIESTVIINYQSIQ